MKFARTVLTTAITLSMASTAMAKELEIYGKANVSFQSSDEGDSRFTDLKSNASRFGIKGILELDDGLSVVYKYEIQVDLADESGSDNLKSRNQYVGLKGDFGEVLLGRNDTLLKQSQGKIDQFNDYKADLKATWKGENRMGDSITYKTKKFSNFQLGVTYISEDEPDGQAGISAALMYGDAKLKKTDFFLSTAIDQDVKGYDTARVMGQFKLNGVKLGLGWQTQELSAGGESQDGYLVSAAYNMNKLTYKAQMQTLEDNDTLSIGVDYKLGKKTKAFAWYSTFDHGVEDKNYLAVGLEHKF